MGLADVVEAAVAEQDDSQDSDRNLLRHTLSGPKSDELGDFGAL
jgi:hypothetical protein